MAELFKNIYNQAFFNKFICAIQEVKPDFDGNSFLRQIYDEEWEDKELKQRMRHITMALKNHLPEDFNENVNTILKIISQLHKTGFKPDNIEFIFFPDFIEIFGIENYKISVRAFEQITQFVSCEFAVRPFIIKYEKEMIEQMSTWSQHELATVRRLSSEGCRPRLPWAMGLPSLKENPEPILPILENLKNDISESVRRSVANNLNDISKDNPDVVIWLVRNWQNKTKETDWLVKHASRTLLKQGNLEVMELFGFGSVDNIKIDDFIIHTPKINIGEYLGFSFKLINSNTSKSKLRLEYGLYYQKANGSLSRKVFKISEKYYAGNSINIVYRKQSFRLITTRKFHVGLHQLSIIINGKEFEKLNFKLIK